jgi:hypothetical protein
VIELKKSTFQNRTTQDDIFKTNICKKNHMISENQEFWELPKHKQMDILYKIDKKPTRIETAFLKSIIKYEDKSNGEDRRIIDLKTLATFQMKNNFESFEFLNVLYSKTENEEIKEWIIEKIEHLSIATKFNQKQRNAINAFIRNPYHYYRHENCEVISPNDFDGSMQQLITGEKEEIWVDVNDELMICNLHIEKIDDQIEFFPFVVQKNKHLYYSNYHVPKSWLFAKEYRFNPSDNINFTKVILDDLLQITSHILSFKDIPFADFKKREKEFTDLMIQIHYDFRQYIIDDYDEPYMKKYLHEAIVEEMVELIWLFNTIESEFIFYQNYMLDLLEKVEKPERFPGRKRPNEYLKTKQYILENFKPKNENL